MTPTKLDLAIIRTSGGTQTRAATHQPTVDEYAEAMKAGGEFPAVSVVFDGEDYWLADGFHRVAAAKQAGYNVILAEVAQGTRRDAVLASVGANASHGLRRTNEDKRRAVETLLKDDEWRQWSDRQIADACKVSHTFVGAVRRAVTGNNASEQRTYTTRHGTTATMNTANIGKRESKVTALDAALIDELAGLSWIDRYKALRKTVVEAALLVVQSDLAYVALREDAKTAAKILGLLSTVNTEYGEALFMGEALYQKLVERAHMLSLYADPDAALKAFHYRHAIDRPAREASQPQPPAPASAPPAGDDDWTPPKIGTGTNHLRTIYNAWRARQPEDALVLILHRGLYLALMKDDSELRFKFRGYRFNVGGFGVRGGADYQLGVKLEMLWIDPLRAAFPSVVIVDYEDLDKPMQWVADRAMSARFDLTICNKRLLPSHIADHRLPDGTRVAMKSGHTGVIVAARGNSYLIQTPNGRRMYRRDYVTALRRWPAETPAAGETCPVSFNDVHQHWDKDAQRWDDPRYVYIGRAANRHGLPESPWHNPFRMADNSAAERQRVIDQYRDYITPRVASGELNLDELRGKTLVCWCSPLPCHGDVLLELLDARADHVADADEMAAPTGYQWADGRPVTPDEFVALKPGDTIYPAFADDRVARWLEGDDDPAIEQALERRPAPVPPPLLEAPATQPFAWLAENPAIGLAFDQLGRAWADEDAEASPGLLIAIDHVQAWLDGLRRRFQPVEAPADPEPEPEPPQADAGEEEDHTNSFRFVSGRASARRWQ